MSYLRFKRLFYGYTFFGEFILIYPIYAVMFSDKGLSPAQISSLFIAWSLTAFIFEVPSGAIADKYSRKNVLLIASLLKIMAFASWLFMPGYLGFLLGFIIWGIESALVSGTTEAFVYDELKKIGKSKEYAKITGRLESLELLAMIAAGVGAAALANKGYEIILGFSILSVVLSGFILLFMPRASSVESTGETKYFTYLNEGVKLALKNSRVFLIIVFGAVVAGLSASDEYYSLLFHEKNFNLKEIAFWTGSIYVFGIIGSLLAYKFENKKMSLGLLLVIWATILLGATLANGIPTALLIGLFIGFFYLIKVLANVYLQSQITDKTRATTTSVGGLMTELFALVVFGLFAIVSQLQSYTLSFQVLAGCIALIGLIYIALGKRYFLKSGFSKST